MENLSNSEEIFKIIKEKFEAPGFIKYNHMQIINISEDYAKMSATIDENSLNPNGTIHGGFLFGLADSVMGAAASTTGRKVCTINSEIDYLKPGQGPTLIAEAEKLKVGRHTAVYRCNIYDTHNHLICTSTGTYFFL